MTKAKDLQQSDQIRYGDEIVQVYEIAILSRGDVLVIFVKPSEDGDDEWVVEADFEIEV